MPAIVPISRPSVLALLWQARRSGPALFLLLASAIVFRARSARADDPPGEARQAPIERGADPGADLDAQIDGTGDDLALVRQARLLIARRIRAGNAVGAAAVADRVRARIDLARFPLFFPVEAALFGGLVGRFEFLAEWRAGTPAPDCCLPFDDGLAAALLERRGQAQRAVAGAGLDPEGRMFAELLLAAVAAGRGAGPPRLETSPAVYEGGREFLARFPASAYRRAVEQTLAPPYRPGPWALEITGGGLVEALAGTASERVAPGMWVSVQGSYRGISLGLLGLGGSTQARRPLSLDSASWEVGDTIERELLALAIGYRERRGRHRIAGTLALGTQDFSRPRDAARDLPGVSVHVLSGLASMGYGFQLGDMMSPSSVLSMPWLLTGRISAMVPLGARGDLPAWGLILQVGLGFELAPLELAPR